MAETLPDFDKLWNYSDPAATELQFREVLRDVSVEQHLSHYLQLQTQIARTYSLRRLYTEAHTILDEVFCQLPESPEVAHIRYHLERGRTYNSDGKKMEAKIHFEHARQIAEKLSQDAYTIDAIHMLAIVANPTEAAKLNEEAIILAENSTDLKAKNWLGSLYNNLGWCYFDRAEYEKALSVFLRSLKWWEDKKAAPQIFVAKWTVARTLRALSQIDNAIKIQLALFEESTTTGKPDGYVHEELGELFLLKNDKLKSTFHFQKAHELLSIDKYFAAHEKERLKRMESFAK